MYSRHWTDTALDLEQTSRLFLQLPLPLPHLRRMHTELLGYSGDRFDVPDRLKRDLRLELTVENLAFPLAHNNPRFPEGKPS